MDTIVVIAATAPSDCDLIPPLRHAGLRVLHHRPEGTLEAILSQRPDLIVFDAQETHLLRALLEGIARHPELDSLPVIAVIDAAQLSETTRLRQLHDFVLRPLRPGELLARVQRPLLRTGRDQADRIIVGELIIDLKGYEALLAGSRIELTYQEFELLKFLVSHPGRAFTRDQLLARVWGYDYYGGSRTVDIHVRRIRAKLGHPHAGWLETIRHVGYKWVPRTQQGGSNDALEGP